MLRQITHHYYQNLGPAFEVHWDGGVSELVEIDMNYERYRKLAQQAIGGLVNLPW
jgi:hypothetical protein